jgi:hypothetical protein
MSRAFVKEEYGSRPEVLHALERPGGAVGIEVIAGDIPPDAG